MCISMDEYVVVRLDIMLWYRRFDYKDSGKMISAKELSKITGGHYGELLNEMRNELEVMLMNCAERGINFLVIKGDEDIELSQCLFDLQEELRELGYEVTYGSRDNQSVIAVYDWWIKWPRKEEKVRDYTFDSFGNCVDAPVW